MWPVPRMPETVGHQLRHHEPRSLAASGTQALGRSPCERPAARNSPTLGRPASAWTERVTCGCCTAFVSGPFTPAPSGRVTPSRTCAVARRRHEPPAASRRGRAASRARRACHALPPHRRPGTSRRRTAAGPRHQPARRPLPHHSQRPFLARADYPIQDAVQAISRTPNCRSERRIPRLKPVRSTNYWA